MCYHMSIMIQVEVVVHSGIKSRVAGEGEGVVAAGEAGEPDETREPSKIRQPHEQSEPSKPI